MTTHTILLHTNFTTHKSLLHINLYYTCIFTTHLYHTNRCYTVPTHVCTTHKLQLTSLLQIFTTRKTLRKTPMQGLILRKIFSTTLLMHCDGPYLDQSQHCLDLLKHNWLVKRYRSCWDYDPCFPCSYFVSSDVVSMSTIWIVLLDKTRKSLKKMLLQFRRRPSKRITRWPRNQHLLSPRFNHSKLLLWKRQCLDRGKDHLSWSNQMESKERKSAR